MRPEFQARSLLGATRAKAKMFEFRVPEDEHIEMGRDPSLLYSLAVGMLGDAASWIADDTIEPAATDGSLPDDIPPLVDRQSSFDALNFAATFFDAYVDSRLDATITDEFSLLCSAAYYLSGNPGSARVVINKIAIPDPNWEGGLPSLVYCILSDAYGPIQSAGIFEDGINVLLGRLRSFFNADLDPQEVLEPCRTLRSMAYNGGAAGELLYADLATALCIVKVRNAARTILPSASDLTFAAWRDALRRPNFPTELWPAQQRLSDAGLLRGASAVVQMPTSAGKTRATELIIRSAFLSDRTRLSVVVAPFRSLCHDIRSDLAKAFSGEDVSVTEATDSFQNDLSLAEILGLRSVLIITPEKLLYVLRRSPEIAQHIGLIVYDEGHQFEGMSRGPTYELLLTSLKLMLAPDTQVVLISAVIGNAPTIARWLLGDETRVVGGAGLLPTTKSIAFASWQDLRGRLEYVVPENPDQREFWVPRVIERTELDLKGREKKPRVFPESTGTDVGLYLGLFVVGNGSVAVFCGRKDTAANLCGRLVEVVARGGQFPLPVDTSDAAEIAGIAALFRRQLGENSDAAQAAAMGVLAHHANVPQGLRLSIEHAMKEGLARFVVCTSTLAQGVNFPIKYLIITGVQQGQDRILVRDFHNLMGRAGRAGMHTEGSVIFSSPNVYDTKTNFKDRWRWQAARELLDPRRAEPCSSSLLNLFADYQQSQPPIVRVIPPEALPLLTFADPQVIEGFVQQALAADGNVSAKEYMEFLTDRAKVVQRIAAFLLAHGLFDQEGAVDRAAQLAENTLAFELANDAAKQGLITVFRGVAQILLDNGDVDLRDIIRRSPLPPSVVSALMQWIPANLEQLRNAVVGDTLANLLIPLALNHVTTGTIHSLSPDANLPDAYAMWLRGADFHEIHGALTATGVRISNRRLKVEDVVALCEGGFGYEVAMVIASLADLMEEIDDVLQRAISLLQRQTKAGLTDIAALVFYEIGFADRSIAQHLGDTFPDVTDRVGARDALRANRPLAEIQLGAYPAYFRTVFRELVDA
ncbi:MAG: DEAD/DEAH box helicase [Rhizobium sp.]|nr:DEAD/DEAH box helicase [Rhizobium sp.]MDM8015812.1 DEAD/DEAH box helicase [Rhizobium sp.]